MKTEKGWNVMFNVYMIFTEFTCFTLNNEDALMLRGFVIHCKQESQLFFELDNKLNNFLG